MKNEEEENINILLHWLKELLQIWKKDLNY